MKFKLFIFLALLLSLSQVQAWSVDDAISMKSIETAALDPSGQYLYYKLKWNERTKSQWIPQQKEAILDRTTHQHISLPEGCTGVFWARDEPKLFLVCPNPQEDPPGQLVAFSPETQQKDVVSEVLAFDGTFSASPHVRVSIYKAYSRPSDILPLGQSIRYPDSELISIPAFKGKSEDAFQVRIPHTKGYTTSINWSRDGRYVLFPNEVENEGLRGLTLHRLYIYDTQQTQTQPIPLPLFHMAEVPPALSPQGGHIGYFRMEGLIQVLSVITKTGKKLQDIPFGEFTLWLSENDLLFSKREKDQFRWHIYSVKENQITPLPLLTSSRKTTLSGDSYLSFIEEDWTTPPHVLIVNFDSIGMLKKGEFFTKQVSLIPDLPSLDLQVQTVRWTSSDDEGVEGTLIYPLNYTPGETYPLMVLLADDKTTGFTRTFLGSIDPHLSRSPALYAEAGYFVFMPHVRGVYGYGTQFAHIESEDIAKTDVEDIITGILYLVDQKLIDKSRVSIFGKGYGGYLALMAAIQHPDLFRSIGTSGAYTDWLIQVGSSFNDTLPRQWLGSIKDNFDLWMSLSPTMHVDRIQSPVRMESVQIDLVAAKSHMDVMAYLLKRFDKSVDAYALTGTHEAYSPMSNDLTLRGDLKFVEKHNPSL